MKHTRKGMGDTSQERKLALRIILSSLHVSFKRTFSRSA